MHKAHQVIGHIFLQIGTVCINVIQSQFIQTIASLPLCIFSEIDLQTVTGAFVLYKLLKGCIAFGFDTDILEGDTVNGNITFYPGFITGIVHQILPVCFFRGNADFQHIFSEDFFFVFCTGIGGRHIIRAF